MSKRKTQTYTPEYRAEAIKLVLEQGLSVSEMLNKPRRYDAFKPMVGSEGMASYAWIYEEPRVLASAELGGRE